MELKAPSAADIELTRKWRNKSLSGLRTPYPLTDEMQEDFYRYTVCNREANSRWWSVYNDDMIALAGLTDIEWENGLAQGSLIVKPEVRGLHYGRIIVDMILVQAFDYMGLSTVYSECYECNPAIEFCKKITETHGGYYTMIPRRKRWQGQLYDALHFSIWR